MPTELSNGKDHKVHSINPDMKKGTKLLVPLVLSSTFTIGQVFDNQLIEGLKILLSSHA